MAKNKQNVYKRDMNAKPQIVPVKINMTDLDDFRETRPERYAGVVMLFVPENEDACSHILLTRRSTKVHSHKGQISFAGGMNDPHDRTIVDTALRELYEETGIIEQEVQPLGFLPTLAALDGCKIFPLVALTRLAPEELRANEQEVEELLFLSWRDLSRSRAQTFNFNLFGHWRTTYQFESQGVNIWGLTAAIIHSANLREP